MSQKPDETKREFLKKSAILGGLSAVAGGLGVSRVFAENNQGALDKGEHEYHLNDPESLIYSVCLGCNTGCPTKLKIQNGGIAKIDGSPYSPWGRTPHIPYKTPLAEAAKIEGVICPKGQGGMMITYDEARIKKVLKRDGPRGAMKWKTMDFHQAIDEIVNGGKLFAHLPGEENRHVEGMKDVYALRDPKIAKEMDGDIEAIYSLKTPEEKAAKVLEFKEKHKDHLHLLINPDHPDLGAKNNQFVWLHGRLKAGRSEFFKRFVVDTLGSTNFHGHTTVCQGSLYFTGKAMSEQYEFDEKKKKMDWVKGQKFFWQGDQSSAEFILFVGSSPFEANYPVLRTPNIMNGLESGRLKFAVIDPRLSKTASKAWKWLPALPGGEGAIALGMIRWMLENNKYDARYLACANKAAATEAGEPTWSNSCWLVHVKDGKPGKFLRASDLKLPVEKRSAMVKEETVAYEFDPFIVLKDGKPVAFDPNDEKTAVTGDLFVDATVEGFPVKTSLQLLAEEANKQTIGKWAEISGIEEQDILDLAQEFTSHGKKAVVDLHRGVSQHTNGFYSCYAWNAVNLLIGNYDWRGGFVKASTYDVSGGKAKGPFDLSKMHPKKAKALGLGILREKKYESSTMFAGYPAKRPWFPTCTDIYQEVLPSVADQYPYPVKILLLYMGTPGYAMPAGNTQVQVLADVEKLPLFIASDITVGESSMFADYIIPDLTFYERWEFHGSHPNNIWKVQTVRQPAVAPFTETVKVFGEDMPISLETFMLAVAEKMKLPGYGPGGFGELGDFKRPEDLYLKMVTNIAFGEKEDGSDQVPEADDEEIRIFQAARKHLPASVFDMERWKSSVGDHWKRLVYVLNRGGKFQDHAKAFDGKQVKNKYGKLINLYSEKIAGTKNSMTGKGFWGLPTYLPIQDSMGKPYLHKEGDLLLTTYKEILHTKSRTSGNAWLRELYPENFILMNSRDARAQGFETGTEVKVVSDTNPEGVWELPNFGKKPMIGKVKVVEGIRPGVISFSLGHGHWAYGASDIWVDGNLIPGDPRRGTGVHANAAMAVDPVLKNVSLQDLVGGSVSFYDSPVRLVRAIAS